jgi:hypothetical protein
MNNELTKRDIAENLEEILGQIKDLMFKAKDLVRGTSEGYQAKSQWIHKFYQHLMMNIIV